MDIAIRTVARKVLLNDFMKPMGLLLSASLILARMTELRAGSRHLLALFVATVLLGNIAISSASANESPASQIERHLNGGSIQKAEPDQLFEAVKQAVASNPKGAAAILIEALSIRRPDIAKIAGDIVGFAIVGLGPQPPTATVTVLVRLAIELQPDALLAIVKAAVKFAPPPMASAIVKTAVAALGNASPEVVAQIIAAASHTKIAKKPRRDGKDIVPLVDGKSVIALEDPEEEPSEIPLMDLETAAHDGLVEGNGFANMMNQEGPRAIPAIPPRGVHPPSNPHPLIPHPTPPPSPSL